MEAGRPWVPLTPHPRRPTPDGPPAPETPLDVRALAGPWRGSQEPLLSEHGEVAVPFRHLFLKDTISRQQLELAEAA